jgi:uridine kinase
MASRRHRAPPILIAIVGGSGSGKTWLAGKLETALAPDAARLALDDFYRDRSHLSPLRRARINFDQPQAIDWVALEAALRALAEGHATRVPSYDFKTHSRNGASVLHSKPIILVDGLWLLRRRSLRHLFRLRIFIDCPTRIRLQRRLERDLSARGRTAASVRTQFRDTVEPMHHVYVVPQARYADIVVGGHCQARDVARLAAEIRAQRARNTGGS